MVINWSRTPFNLDLLTWEFLIKSGNTIPVEVPVHLPNGGTKMEIRYKSPEQNGKKNLKTILQERYKKLQEKKAAEAQAVRDASEDKTKAEKQEAMIDKLVDRYTKKTNPTTPKTNSRLSPTEQMFDVIRKKEQSESVKRAEEDAIAKKKAKIRDLLDGKHPSSSALKPDSLQSVSYSPPKDVITFTNKADLYSTLGWDVEKHPEDNNAIFVKKDDGTVLKRHRATGKSSVSLEEAKKLPFSDWTSKLSNRERQRCENFLNKNGFSINRLLGGLGQAPVPTPLKQNLVDQLGSIVQDLDSAINKFELPTSISVYTSVYVPRSATLNDLFPEGKMMNPGYTVAACSKNSAYVTMGSPNGEALNNHTHKCITLKIDVPAGKGVGAFLGPMSESGGQHFVFPRGTEFHLSGTPSVRKLRQYSDILNLKATVVGRSFEEIDNIKQKLLSS